MNNVMMVGNGLIETIYWTFVQYWLQSSGMRSVHVRSTLSRRNSGAMRVIAWVGLGAVGALVGAWLVLFAAALAGLAGALPAEAITAQVGAWVALAAMSLFVAACAARAIGGLRRAHLAGLDFSSPLAALPRIEPRHGSFIALPAARPPRFFS